MSDTHSVELDTSDWLRRPGDNFEIKAMLERLRLKDLASPAVFELAKQHLREAVSGEDEEVASAHLSIGRVLLWVSASFGIEDACGLLSDEIDSYVRANELAHDIQQVCEATSAGWRSKVSRKSPLNLKKRKPSVDADVQELMEEMRGIPDEGTVVITSLGDEKSPEGVNLARRYGRAVGAVLPSRIVMPEAGLIQSVIEQEWPWAAKIGVHIENMLAVQRSVGLSRPVLKPMLFVGPPGSGKTKLAMRVAELFNLPSVVVSAGSTGDAAGLASVTRGWAGTRPCGPVVAALQHNCCDPAIIVDEIDKGVAAGSKNGSAVGTLLGMLGTPEKFNDTCLLSDVNLSKMLFMATSNSLSALSQPLLDRFSILLVGRPQKEHFPVVLQNMKKGIAGSLGVHVELLPRLTGDEYEVLKRQFIKGEGSLRDFNRALEFVLSQAAGREALAQPQLLS